MLSLPTEDVAQRYGLPIERARVLPGGALLMLAMMDYLSLDEMRVSDHGVREGVLLAYARYGEHWLDPAVAPSAGQRYDLEHMLRKQEQSREQQYQALRRHWYHLQEQDFFRHVLAVLDKEAVGA